MGSPFEETIITLMPELGRKLSVTNDFINHLRPSRIMSTEERDTIMVEKVSISRNTVFLRTIMNKPETKAMSVLLKALRQTAQGHLADEIEKEYAKHTAAAAEIFYTTHGSYRVKDANCIVHLCKCDGYVKYKVREIGADALVYCRGYVTPSLPGGVDLVGVDSGMPAAVGGVEDAERRGHRSVAVMPGFLKYDTSITPVADHAASRRHHAAAHIWVMWWVTDDLSKWQQQLSRDPRYQRLN